MQNRGMDYYKRLSPWLMKLPPEFAHGLAVRALALGMVPPQPRLDLPRLQTEVAGLNFRHPVGLAAGFDKNGEAVANLFIQGFSFVECGTVTPRPQAGNKKPRMFRIPEEESMINQMGFNNAGLSALQDAMRIQHKKIKERRGIVGINIGVNKDSSTVVMDYVTMLQGAAMSGDYITLNISSPNTPGLRDLQAGSALEELLTQVFSAREKMFRKVPIWLKVAPDLNDEQCGAVVETIRRFPLQALIVSNSTIMRPDSLSDDMRNRPGGLTGKLLMGLSTNRLQMFYHLTEGKIPLVGVGGIASAKDAYMKIRSGASLVQLYTALGYQGFQLVTDIQTGLDKYLERDGFASVKDAVGADLRR